MDACIASYKHKFASDYFVVYQKQKMIAPPPKPTMKTPVAWIVGIISWVRQEGRIADLEEHIVAAQTQILDATSRIADLEEQLNRARTQYVDADRRVKELEEELDKARTRYVDATRRVKELEEERVETQRREEMLTSEIQRQQGLHELDLRLKTESFASHLEAQLQTERQKLNEIEEHLATERDRCRDLEQHLSDADAILYRLSAEQDRVQQLEKEIREERSKIEKLNVQIAETRMPTAPSNPGAVGEFQLYRAAEKHGTVIKTSNTIHSGDVHLRTSKERHGEEYLIVMDSKNSQHLDMSKADPQIKRDVQNCNADGGIIVSWRDTTNRNRQHISVDISGDKVFIYIHHVDEHPWLFDDAIYLLVKWKKSIDSSSNGGDFRDQFNKMQEYIDGPLAKKISVLIAGIKTAMNTANNIYDEMAQKRKREEGTCLPNFFSKKKSKIADSA